MHSCIDIGQGQKQLLWFYRPAGQSHALMIFNRYSCAHPVASRGAQELHLWRTAVMAPSYKVNDIPSIPRVGGPGAALGLPLGERPLPHGKK